MRRTLAVLAALAALGAGCGDSEQARDTTPTTTTSTPSTAKPATTDLAGVEVTGAAGEQPTLTFEAPLSLDKSTSRVLTEGDGEVIAVSSVATFDFVFVNGRTGKVLGTSYDTEPASLVFDTSLMTGIYQGLAGVKAGSRVLVGITPADGPGADTTNDVLDTDTLLFFAEVIDVRVPLARAEGTAVPPVAGLPTVALASDGAPTITVPATAPPTELVAQPLIEGTGAVVQSGQSITVHYTGVLWDGGTVFDSSWQSGSPATFSIGTGAVIPGWDEGLVGRTVGSQILLVVPPAKGYPEGSPDGSIKATDTIVFVVDILDAG